MANINIGLTQEEINGVVEILNHQLADFYILQIKTKKYHWDVVGPQFLTLHKIWQEHYETFAENIDAIAERVRQLGEYPIGTAELFIQYSTVEEHSGDLPNATQMVQRLISDHEKIIRNLRQHVDACSNRFHDEGTADFLIGLMTQLEEMSWMLRSFLGGQGVEPSGERQRELVTH